LSVLFDESEIARQVARLSEEIARHTPRVDLMVPILTGAFVFAADLLRALNREGFDIPVEFISLTRYGTKREGADITVRMGASDAAKEKHVLLVDGVLDHGHTLVKAKTLLLDAGAASVAIAVAVDKLRADALLKADYVAFKGADGFIVGYGMDDAGLGRGLPYIGKVG
jgi:hypoxanthine phosphoribosyltransferase